MSAIHRDYDTTKGRQQRFTYIVLCIALASLCAFGSVYYAARERAFTNRSITTEGIVVSAEHKPAGVLFDRCGRTSSCLKTKIDFRDASGAIWSIIQLVPSLNSYRYHYRIGSRHTVWYLSDSPDTNFTGSMGLAKRSWFIALLFMIPATLVFAVLAGWLYFSCDDRDLNPNQYS